MWLGVDSGLASMKKCLVLSACHSCLTRSLLLLK